MSPAPQKAPPLPDGSRNRNPAGLGFWALVREDFRTHGRNVASQGFWAVACHRFGNVRMSWPRPLRAFGTLAYEVLRVVVQVVCGIKLDYTVQLGRRVRIEHFGGIVIGARSIGDDVIIRQNTTLGIRSLDDLNAKPIVGSRVEIGAGAVIVGHVTIGDDCVIGANCVVAADVPANSFVRPPRPDVVPRRMADEPEVSTITRRVPAHRRPPAAAPAELTEPAADRPRVAARTALPEDAGVRPKPAVVGAPQAEVRSAAPGRPVAPAGTRPTSRDEAASSLESVS